MLRKSSLKWIVIITLLSSVIVMAPNHNFARAAVTGVVFPADSGVVNVKTEFGAKGDGTTDDTTAIQNGLTATRGKAKALYFPAGTYIVSNKLTYGSDLGSCKRSLIQGQDMGTTIIKLKNSTTGFTDAAVKKPVLTFFEGSSTGQAFMNQLKDITIDTGSGNLGAVGVQFINNNWGALVNVTIKSSDSNKAGAVGLDLTKSWVGPGLFKNITIDGFNYGIDTSQYEYSQVFEHITLKNQKIAGLRNGPQMVTIRDLKSTNSVPAIQLTSGSGMVSLYDSVLSGGISGNSAIYNKGKLLLRNVTQSGYGKFIDNETDSLTDVTGTSLTEYVSHPIEHLFDSPQKTLNLPIEETPNTPWDAPSTWVKVDGSAADDTANIQAAFDYAAANSKTTVYFPKGDDQTWKVSGTIKVYGSVRRVMGMYNIINLINPLSSSTNPLFRVENISNSDILFEGFERRDTISVSDIGTAPTFEHATSKNLIIKHMNIDDPAYRSVGTVGKVFIEDVTGGGGWNFRNGQKVWARQLNPESYATMIMNDNATLWILGLKIERWGTIIHTKNGGKTELLGGLMYPAMSNDGKGNTDYPTPFIIENASATLSFLNSANDSSTPPRYWIKVLDEIRDGVTKSMFREDFLSRGWGIMCPLYTGYKGQPSTLPFTDDFEDGNATGWTPSGGSWSVVTDGTKMYKQSSASSSASSYTGDSTWENYSFESKVKPISYGSSPAFTLSARRNDDDNRYNFGYSNGSLIISKKVNGTTTILASKAYNMSTGTTYTLKVVTNVSTLDLYVNGTKQLTATDSSLPTGKISLNTYNAAVEFDNISVTIN